MAKTKPIGVRFDEELLNKVKEASIASSPQKALNLYEKSYVELVERKVEENNKPENKAKIEEERNPTETEQKNHQQPTEEAIDIAAQIKELENKIKLVPQGQYYNKVVKSYNEEIEKLKAKLSS